MDYRKTLRTARQWWTDTPPKSKAQQIVEGIDYAVSLVFALGFITIDEVVTRVKPLFARTEHDER